MHAGLRALLAACSAAFAFGCAAADPPVSSAQPIGPGAWLVPGRLAIWSPDGPGQVANSGFIVGRDCVAVIDGGGSVAVGRALLAAVRERSSLPVCYVISTHAHPDHVLGNGAFVDAGGATPTRFVAHRRFAAAQAARAPHWLNVLRHEAAAGEPPPVLPTTTMAVMRRQMLV